ncbi:RHS repeat domain-containing protein, partial [Neisseria oralis]|uniref:RHS repeat domain-containing protein n=1 Tax=Neisseria oralis TaxID=1107316 RepID=UPI0027E1A39C
YQGSYTHIYTDQDSYEPLAQIFHNAKDEKQYLAYIHTDQIGIPREMTDMYGNLLWYGEYSAWGRLNRDERVYQNVHQPFRLQNQYYDRETGLHYNLMRYYEAETGRFINQDPIGLWGGENLYAFAPNAQAWVDPLGLAHSMFGELIRDGKTIFSNSYTSGNGVGTGRLNQQQALQTHTERKFLADIKDMVRPGDTIKMKGELNPCRPGCQPAIRDFVGEKGVNAEYHATNTGKTYKWKRMPDGKVLQTEKAGSKIKAFIYNLITRRRKPSKC